MHFPGTLIFTGLIEQQNRPTSSEFMNNYVLNQLYQRQHSLNIKMSFLSCHPNKPLTFDFPA